MKTRSRRAMISIMLAGMLAATFSPFHASAIERPSYPDNPPAYQYKDVFSEKMVTIPGGTIPVTEDGYYPVQNHEFTFEIYNSTTQKFETTVTTENGYLPELQLHDDFNYIFYLPYDDTYRIARSTSNLYVWMREGQLVDIKSYLKNKKYYDHSETGYYTPIESIAVAPYNPADSRRYSGERHDNVYVCYDGQPVSGVEITFTSEDEVVRATSDSDGKVHPNLLEDVNYMVSTEDPRYEIDPFPIAVKDKSEYDSSKFFYDHSSCHRVGLKYKNDAGQTVMDQPITLLDRGKSHLHDTTAHSLSDNTEATGMNFKDIILSDRTLDQQVDALEGKEYDVFDIVPVNPHRWEYCKLATGDYTVTEKTPGKKAASVYIIDSDGTLKPAEISNATNGEVSFHMDSLGIHPVVIEYGELDPEPAAPVKPTVKPVRITVRPTSITKLAKGKKQFKVTWKKLRKTDASGYQIQYSTSKTFKKAKTAKITSYKTGTKTIQKLKAKKKYYVRVRTYRKTGGKTYTSKWSSVRSVRVR